MGDHGVDEMLNPWLYQIDGGVSAPTAGSNDEVRVAQNSGGDTGDLVQVAPAVLLGISAAAGRIRQELGVAGRQADDTTTEAAQSLTREHFDLGPALKTAGDLWYSQMTTLHQACHKIEQSIAANANGHAMTEDASEMLMKDIARQFQ